MAGLTQARWPSWPLLRRAESASREGDALPRPSFRGCLFGSSLLHRAPPPDKQAAASRSRPPCEACQGGLLMRSRCKPCRCRCNPSEFQRLLVALPCYSAPLGAGTRVPILGLQRSPPTTKVHTAQCRLASKASTGGHEGRWKMEAQAAEPSLRAHRRPPERPEGSAAP